MLVKKSGVDNHQCAVRPGVGSDWMAAGVTAAAATEQKKKRRWRSRRQRYKTGNDKE